MTLELDTLTLETGKHGSRESGVCLLEAVAWFAGQPHTDHPPCVSPVLAQFGRSVNDMFPADRRQQLKVFIPQLPGTADDGRDEARGMMALDWLIRTYTPAFLELVPDLREDAGQLRGLAPIINLPTAHAAGLLVKPAATKAAAAWAVAGAAAWAAAGDAAWAAAGAAAWDVAGAAAWAAAGDAARAAARAAAGAAAWPAARAAAWAAAWAAAGDAARAAARAALAPTVDSLQESASELFSRMISAA